MKEHALEKDVLRSARGARAVDGGSPEPMTSERAMQSAGNHVGMEGPAKQGLGLDSGAGRPLPPTVLSKMEQALGSSFADVRVQESPQVAAMGARAFTRGEQIHFAPGQYQPESPSGLKLLAHELTHVIQQRQGRVRPTTGVKIVQDGALEAEADAMGSAALSGAAPGAPSRASGKAPADGPIQPKMEVTGAQLRQRSVPKDAEEAVEAAVVARLQGVQDALNAYHAAADVQEHSVDTLCRLAELIAACEAFASDEARETHHVGNVRLAALTELAGAFPACKQQVMALDEPEKGAALGRLKGFPELKKQFGLEAHKKHEGFQGAEADAGTLAGIEQRYFVIQNAQARGDMYQVKAVLGLFPQLEIVIYGVDKPSGKAEQRSKDAQSAHMWSQACVMANYYNLPDRVFYTYEGGISSKASKGAAYDFFKVRDKEDARPTGKAGIDVGGCTTLLGLYLAEGQQKGDFADRMEKVAEAEANTPKAGDGRAPREEIVQKFEAMAFEKGTSYVLINYRDSGHKHVENQLKGVSQKQRKKIISEYEPDKPVDALGNHPELDTGVSGIQQIAKAVREHGHTPVFMGEEPADAKAPHLIKYWMWPECEGGRESEAYLLRVLAEEYKVKAIAMRSGVTDQLALLNIPVISIDIDTFLEKETREAFGSGQKPGYIEGEHEVADSWARGSKLEAGMGRHYGRVFMRNRRDLKQFSRKGGKWQGEISSKDMASISDSIDFYFGNADPEKNAKKSRTRTEGIRHASHPLHPDRLDETARKDSGNRDKLDKNLAGKNDVNLNPDLVLNQARKLIGDGKDKEANDMARRFLESHLEYAVVPDLEEDDKKEYVERKRADRDRFIEQATALLDTIPEVKERNALIPRAQAHKKKLVATLNRATGLVLARCTSYSAGADLRDQLPVFVRGLENRVEAAVNALVRSVIEPRRQGSIKAHLTELEAVVTELQAHLEEVIEALRGGLKKHKANNGAYLDRVLKDAGAILVELELASAVIKLDDD